MGKMFLCISKATNKYSLKKGPEERVQINENLDNRGSTVIAYFTEQTVEKNHSLTRINIKFNTAL